MKLFITGSTGYLGKKLIPQLSVGHEHLYLLIRKNSLVKAKSLFGHLKNVTFVKGDLTNPDLIDEVESDIYQNIEGILHMGAFYDLQGDNKTCFLQNVLGTQNVTFFSGLCPNLKHFHYVSTIAISGEHRGVFEEDDFDLKQSFSNPYSETKFEAERVVRKLRRKNINVTIYRPGIIIGDSETGEFDKIDGPYYFWQTISKITGLLPGVSNLPIIPLPLVENARLPLISVDHVANSIEKGIIVTENQEFNCFHLVGKEAPLVKELIEFSLKKFKIRSKILVINNHPLIDKAFDYLGLPKEIIHYMITDVKYTTKNSFKLLELGQNKSFNEYRDIIISKAISKFKERK